jgi:hypothetical protein
MILYILYCTSTHQLAVDKGSSDFPRLSGKARSVLVHKIVIYIPNKKHDIVYELKENPPDKTAKSLQASFE